jgi:autophagy-related protein 18
MSRIIFLNFTRDGSSLAVGTERDYKLFRCNPFVKYFENADGGMGQVVILNRTSLIAMVGAGQQPTRSPRLLHFCTMQKSKGNITLEPFKELKFDDTIINVKLNNQCIVVVCESQISIYITSSVAHHKTISTVSNPRGIVAVSTDDTSCFVAFPTKQQGEVSVVDAITGDHVCNIPVAHTNPICCICLNTNGTLVATASNKGTKIRVHGVPSGNLIHVFQRGGRDAQICSMSFSLDSTLLSVSSNRHTVHFYKLKNSDSISTRKVHVPGSLMNLGSNLWETWVTREQIHFAVVKLKVDCDAKNVCGFLEDCDCHEDNEQEEPMRRSRRRVLIATFDGFLYQYSFDYINGGECVLENEHRLFGS